MNKSVLQTLNNLPFSVIAGHTVLSLFLVIPTLLFVLFGCSERISSGHYVKEFYEVFHIDTVIIKLDHHSSNYYENASAVFETDSTVCLVFYNRHTHSLDWFSPDYPQKIMHTRLDRQGPDAIPGDLIGLFVHNTDTIFANDGMFLMMINKQGKVLAKTSNQFSNDQGSFSLVNHSHLPLYYNPENNSVFGAAIEGGKLPDKDLPVFLEVNMTNFSAKFHTVLLPGFFVSQGRYPGLSNQMNGGFARENIIYNFQSGSDIYVYSLNSKESFVTAARTPLSKNQMAPLSSDNPDDEWKHYVENPRFFKVSFCRRNNLYYRLHWKEIPYHGSGAEPHSPYDKPLILTVFDQNFNAFAEVLLPNDMYLISGAEQPTLRGFFLFASHPRKAGYDPEKMELHFLSFK